MVLTFYPVSADSTHTVRRQRRGSRRCGGAATPAQAPRRWRPSASARGASPPRRRRRGGPRSRRPADRCACACAGHGVSSTHWRASGEKRSTTRSATRRPARSPMRRRARCRCRSRPAPRSVDGSRRAARIRSSRNDRTSRDTESRAKHVDVPSFRCRLDEVGAEIASRLIPLGVDVADLDLAMGHEAVDHRALDLEPLGVGRLPFRGRQGPAKVLAHHRHAQRAGEMGERADERRDPARGAPAGAGAPRRGGGSPGSGPAAAAGAGCPCRSASDRRSPRRRCPRCRAESRRSAGRCACSPRAPRRAAAWSGRPRSRTDARTA